MKLLNKYVLNEWVLAFTTIIIAALGLLILQEIYRDLQDLIICGATFRKLCSYYYRTVISFLPSILPISLLISILFTISKLNNNNEIIAIRASGIQFWSTAEPIVIISCILTAICLILNTSASPKAFEKNRRYLKNIKLEHKANRQNSNSAFFTYNDTFFNQKDNRIWFISKINTKTNEYFNVNIYQNDNNEVEIERISAASATYNDITKEWMFINGKETKYQPETKLPVFSKQFESKIINNWVEDPNIISIFNKHHLDLSFNDLGKVIKHSKNKKLVAKYSVRYYNTIAQSFSCILISMLAIPLAIRRTRTNPMVGITRAILILFIFYVASSVFLSLGTSGKINYMLAAWLPNICFAILAIKLYKRAK